MSVYPCCEHCGVTRGHSLPGERHLPHPWPCLECQCADMVRCDCENCVDGMDS